MLVAMSEDSPHYFFVLTYNIPTKRKIALIKEIFALNFLFFKSQKSMAPIKKKKKKSRSY